MKKISIICLLLIVMLGLGGCADTSAQIVPITAEELPIYFFHDTACGTCDGTAEFMEIVSKQIAVYKEAYPYKLIMYNVFKSDGWEAMQSILAKYGIDRQELSFPLMLVNGNVYEGLEAIEDNMKREYLKNTGLTATYFYREDCQECIDVKAFMDSLPEKIIIEDTEIPFHLIRLNSREGNNGDRIREIFEKYEVPEEKQMVPFVLVGDCFLAGKEEIEENLILYLEQGCGLGYREE